MLKATLLPHQEIGFDWVLKNEYGGCILSDDMGLGKTVTTIAVLCKEKVKTLLVVPLALISQWQSEITRHSSGFSLSIYSGQKRKPDWDATDIVITTYGTFLSDFKKYGFITDFWVQGGFQRIVLDEAHKIKNPESVSYDALKIFIEQTKIPRQIFLTGTPICNEIEDILSLFRLMSCPDKTYQELKQRVLRRTKEQVLQSQLPAIQVMDIPKCLSKDSKQGKYYHWAEEYKMPFLSKILRTRQCANEAKLIPKIVVSRVNVEADAIESLGLQEKDKKPIRLEPIIESEIGQKLTQMMEIVNAVPRDEKIVIFSCWRSMLHCAQSILDTYSIQSRLYHGLMNSAERQQVVQEFYENPEVRVMLVSLKAGGCGLNLVSANHVIVLEPYFTWADEKQAIDRVYRIGQTKPVSVYKLWATSTVEDWMRDLQESKRRIAIEVLGC